MHEREIVCRDVGTARVNAGPYADLHRGVRHGPHDARGGIELATDFFDGHPRGDGEKKFSDADCPQGRHDFGEDLRLDGEDGEVALTHDLFVVGDPARSREQIEERLAFLRGGRGANQIGGRNDPALKESLAERTRHDSGADETDDHFNRKAAPCGCAFVWFLVFKMD